MTWQMVNIKVDHRARTAEAKFWDDEHDEGYWIRIDDPQAGMVTRDDSAPAYMVDDNSDADPTYHDDWRSAVRAFLQAVAFQVNLMWIGEMTE